MSDPLLPPNKGEKLIRMVNEHWMILVNPISLYVLGLIFGGFLFLLGDYLRDLAHPAGMVLVFVAYLEFLIIHHWLFIYLLSLELSGWAITQKRIIEFQFLPYVRHDMIYINIDDVTESEKHQHGILKNMFHYGEVELNLASSGETVEFHYVPYPGIFVETINRLQKPS